VYEHIQGKFVKTAPTHAVVEAAGIGYWVNISLNTYEVVKGLEQGKLFLHQVVREDEFALYGFATEDEREVFRLLLSVSGIGAATARLMLSSLSPAEVVEAVRGEKVAPLKAVKGLGEKTARRVIVDLKDKVAKLSLTGPKSAGADNSAQDEAFSALLMLGFGRAEIEKALRELSHERPLWKVEDLLRAAIQKLSKSR